MGSADPLLQGEKRKLTRLRKDLLGWFELNGRDLPWRKPSADTYQQIVVEVLLQRTTAAAVRDFFAGFVERFPDWTELAATDPAELENFLKPLGLWRRRAASLVGIARYAAKHGGQFPHNTALHDDIPAVGQYVSNAILVFQHGLARPLLDVNMARVIERFVRPRRLADIRYDPWLQEAAYWLVHREGAAQVNWAVLDFAAMICKTRNPRCDTCPVQARCAYVMNSKL